MTKEQLTEQIQRESHEITEEVLRRTQNPNITTQDATNVFIYSKLAELQLAQDKHYGFYQLCPKCDGEGELFNPYSGTATKIACPVCNGAKLLVRPEIKKEEPGE